MDTVKPTTPGADDPHWKTIESDILSAIRAIRYGSVEISIHDSRVVQIERKEKLRFEPGGREKDAQKT